jgi:DNA-binding transcriptional MerR regulator
VELFRADDIERIEREHPLGLTARKLVGLFTDRGVRLTEGTFRKYVQAGLLPRSKRVGKKGKHQGSQGLYPASAVRRLNLIKQMMAQGETIEAIKSSFVGLTQHIDLANHELGLLFDGYERQLENKPLAGEKKKELVSRLRSLRVQSRQLLSELSHFGSGITAKSPVAV